MIKKGLSNHKLMQYLPLAVLLIIVVALIILFWPKAAVSKNGLGQCLTEKGVTMYGSDLCPNCQNQKKILGEDFQDVNYVNCDFEREQCHKKGITVYPVWSMGNNIMLGTQSKADLAAFAGCPIND